MHMVVKTVVSGKRPVVVRVDTEDYAVAVVEAAKEGKTLNELLADYVHDLAEDARGKDEP